jgi:pyruvate/2-oxoglutarate dehydrogenase complex dihydrolipoamide dehydrogenase (E3) component
MTSPDIANTLQIQHHNIFSCCRTVAVEEEGGIKTYTAKTILIAVGGWPFVPVYHF